VVCQEQAAALRPHVGAIREAGGELVIVGNGSPAQALAFRDAHSLDVPVLADPSLQSYRLAGFKRGLTTLVSPRSLWNYARTLARGYRQSETQGDALQQGGVLVVRPGGELAFRFVSRASGDHAPPARIVAAVRGN
jgi:hypothetical protein